MQGPLQSVPCKLRPRNRSTLGRGRVSVESVKGVARILARINSGMLPGPSTEMHLNGHAGTLAVEAVTFQRL